MRGKHVIPRIKVMGKGRTPWGKGDHGWKKYSLANVRANKITPVVRDGSTAKTLQALKQEALEKELDLMNSFAAHSTLERHYPKEFTIKKEEAEE